MLNHTRKSRFAEVCLLPRNRQADREEASAARRLPSIVWAFVVLASSLAIAQDTGWQAGIGTPGLNGNVYALAVFDDDGPGANEPALYVGGEFTLAGGVTVQNIAKWDGKAWSWVFPLNAGVHALEAWDSDSDGWPELYAGGDFSFSPDWNYLAVMHPGTGTWAPLPASDLQGAAGVRALAAWDGGGVLARGLYIPGAHCGWRFHRGQR